MIICINKVEVNNKMEILEGKLMQFDDKLDIKEEGEGSIKIDS